MKKVTGMSAETVQSFGQPCLAQTGDRIRERQMDAAIAAIAALDVVHGEVHRIRVETLDGD